VRPLALVYRALGLGDFLTAVPALRALRRALPGHRVVIVAPRGIAPLAQLSGAIDEVVDVMALAPLPSSLHGADVAVNLHGAGPQSHRLLLATSPRQLIGFANSAVPEHAGPSHDPTEHEVARWCRLLSASGISADPQDLDLPIPPWPAPAAAEGATVVHPGAASAARRWPAERWAAVVRAETAVGHRVLITGSRAERPLARQVAAGAGLPDSAVLAGRTDLRALTAVVAAARRVASGDTGVAHLATAFATPSVTLFGPTPPSLWGPPPDRPWHMVLWAGRSGNPHAQQPDPGLLLIEPAAVTAALARLAVAPAPGRQLDPPVSTTG
jgi:ADP-heptose:LPS heptosyltransferase